MRLHAPSPPQGKNNSSLLFSLLPPHLQYSPPEGIGVTPSGPVMAYEPANWADAAYLQRIPLTINALQVPSPQNDFVLLINSTFPALINQSVGSIRIGTNDFTVDYEIQKFDTVTGELIAWAKVPSISNGDVFNIYFDNPNAPDDQNPFEVWSDYSNVYHLNNVVATDSILDSARAQEPGDPIGTTLVAAKIGDGQLFDQTIPDMILLPKYQLDFSFTISMWINTTDTNRGSLISVTVPVTEENAVATEVQVNGTIRYVYRNPPSFGGGVIIDSSPVTVNDGVFHKIVFVYDDAGDIQELFIDGVLISGAINSLPPQSAATTNSVLGVNRPTVGNFSYNGIIDEFQTFRGVLSDDRILAEFRNQNAPDTFYSTGTVQVVPTPVDTMGYEPANWADAAFLQRFPLTINGGQVPSIQNDFVLLINDTFSELVGESVESIRIGTNDFTVDYEIQEFDSGDGKLIAWAKKPTVDNGDVIFVYFDGPNTVDNQNPFEVWSDYAATYHMSQPTGNILDSTGNANTAVNTGTVTIAGKIGDARDFNGTSDFLEAAASLSLNITDKITISFWVETPFVSSQIVGRDEGAGGNRPYNVGKNIATDCFTIMTTTTSTLDGTIQPLLTFYLIDATYDGAQMKLYRDGVLDTTVSKTGNIFSSATIPLLLGKRGDNILFFDGILDEVTISDTAFDADYFETKFNNQNSQSTFYTKGAVEAVPASTVKMGYEE